MRTALALAVVLISQPALAQKKQVATLHFVEGQMTRQRQGSQNWLPVDMGAPLYRGDKLKTDEKSRAELKLNDGSMLRLGTTSELHLEKLSFRKRKKEARVKLMLGRVWASVRSFFGGEKFVVATPNAVCGVRGTRFATSADASGTTVKVYSGKVLVSNKPSYALKGHHKGNRKEVVGPQEISKKQWEDLVASAMQMVKVSSTGAMSPALNFETQAAQNAWEAWNLERDKAAGISK